MPWLEHFRHLWFYHRQDYFRGWDPLGPAEELGEQPQLLFQGRRRAAVTAHAQADGLYPPMRKIRFTVRAEKNWLRFTLDHSYPFWSHFEMSVNGARWTRCTDKPGVRLRKGRMQVRFRAGGEWKPSSGAVGLTVLYDADADSGTRPRAVPAHPSRRISSSISSRSGMRS